MKRDLPRWADIIVIPALNLAMALLMSGLVVIIIGENPVEAMKYLVYGSVGYGEGIGYTLYYATNFIFTGLAVAVAFHAGLFNIGGEGQAYVAGIGVAIFCLWLDNTHWLIVFPLAVFGGAAFGAAWAAIPGYLQAKRGSHVVITTIMFNFIASALLVYLLVNVMKVPGSMATETRSFEAGAHLPFMNEIAGWVGWKIDKSPLNMSFFLALVSCVAVWVLIWKTKLGYAMRTLGHSTPAALYAGISPARIIIIAMAISGALAGLMAVNEIMGVQHRLLLGYTAGYGFVGIAVALMGRNHPVGIFFAAILFGMLYQGGAELAFEMPSISRDMIVVIQGMVILFTGAMDHMFRPAIIRLLSFGRTKEEGA